MIITSNTTKRILTRVKAVPARAPRPRSGASRATNRKIRIRLIILLPLLRRSISLIDFPSPQNTFQCPLGRALFGGQPDGFAISVRAKGEESPNSLRLVIFIPIYKCFSHSWINLLRSKNTSLFKFVRKPSLMSFVWSIIRTKILSLSS